MYVCIIFTREKKHTSSETAWPGAPGKWQRAVAVRAAMRGGDAARPLGLQISTSEDNHRKNHRNIENSWENHRKTIGNMGNSWENHRRTIGKLKTHGKTIGEP